METNISIILSLNVIFTLYILVWGRCLLKFVGLKLTNPILKTSLSFIVGITSIVFVINLLMYIISMRAAVIVFILLTLFIIFRYRSFLSVTEWLEHPRTNLLFFAFLLTLLSLVHIGSGIYDSHFHQALSYTLLDGNFPPRSPWNPNVLLPYHYAFDLLMAIWSLVTLTPIYYVNDPIHITLGITTFGLIYGLMREANFNGRIAFCTAWGGTGMISLSAIDLAFSFFKSLCSVKNTFELYSAIVAATQFPHPQAYFAASLRWPVALEIPVLLLLVILAEKVLFTNIGKAPLINMLLVVVWSFLCLCEETLFAVFSISLVLFFTIKMLKSRKGGASILSFSILCTASLAFAIIQGGVLTTRLLLRPISPNTIPSALQVSPFSFDVNTTWPLLQFLHSGGLFVFIEMVAAPFLVIYFLRNTLIPHNMPPPSKFWLTVIFITFLVGYTVASFFHWRISPRQMERLFYFWIPSACIGFIFGHLLNRAPKLKSIKQFLMMFATISLLGSALFFGAQIAVSLAYWFVGSQRYEIQDKIAQGRWIHQQLPSGSVLVGFDPRYSGKFSFGGNKYMKFGLDTMAINTAIRDRNIPFLAKLGTHYFLTDTIGMSGNLTKAQLAPKTLVTLPDSLFHNGTILLRIK